MDCKFLDSYAAESEGRSVEVWYCRKRDPFVLGASREIALRTCASCRLSDYTRPPMELAHEVERRNQELAALNTIVAAVNSTLDLDGILTTGLEKVIDILQVDGGWLLLAGDEGLTTATHRGVSDVYLRTLDRQGGGEGLVALVMRQQETVVVEDAKRDALALAAARREGFVTLVGVPLKAQGQMLGVLVFGTRSPRAYSADDLYFTSAAGAQLASAIEHALLFRRLTQRAAQGGRLLAAAETVNKSLDSHALAETIVSEAARLMGADKSALLVKRGDMLVCEAVHNLSDVYRKQFALPLEGTLSGSAVTNAQTVAVDDVDGEVLVDEYLVGAGGYRAFLTAPLVSREGTYGALCIYYDQVHQFTEDEKTVLRTFANQAAIALDNQQLMREKDALATHDGLTGVYNRAYLEMALERTMKQVHRNGGGLSLLFLDVDDLKGVNDRHGHQTGDRLLKELADLLSKSCRESDIVARYGGDEFVILMPDTDEEGAQRVRDKIQRTLQARNRLVASDVPLSASLGVHTSGWTEADELLAEADRRMYEMKRGRSRA